MVFSVGTSSGKVFAQSIFSSTFKSSLSRLSENIFQLLPKQLAMGFDGWSTGNTHFTGTFATSSSKSAVQYDNTFLGLSPMENETTQNLKEQFEYLEFVLSMYGREMRNLADLVGDNNSTNRAFARMVGPIFVGCHSHRFNFGVNDILGGHSDVIQKVQALVRRLPHNNPR